MAEGCVVIVGGTAGLGLEVARHYATAGRSVVLVGRDAERAERAAVKLGGAASGRALDLTRPETIGPALAGVEAVDHLVLSAILRDENAVRDYDVSSALTLATMKIVGYTETVHQLLPRMHDETSVVLFGGRAKDRPYPGSVTVTSVNGAMSSAVRSFAFELRPIRFNAIHPGIVGDSPYWSARPDALAGVLARTPTNRLVTMADVVDATVFLLENRSVNGVDLYVDAGWMLM